MTIRYTKDQALALMHSSHAALDQILDALGEEQLAQGQLSDGWKVKDVLAHLTSWEHFLVGNVSGDPDAIALRRSLSGDDAVNQLNASVLAAHRDRLLTDLQAEYQTSFQSVVAAISALSDAQFAEYHNLIAFNTYDHYLEHAQQLSRWALTKS